MEKRIYQTSVRYESTGREHELFQMEAEYAKEQGFDAIVGSDDVIVDLTTSKSRSNTSQVSIEDIVDLLSDVEDTAKEEAKPEYTKTELNIMAIDDVIYNTLQSDGKLSTESCDNMLRLAELKNKLLLLKGK